MNKVTQQQVEYSKLNAGYEFEPARFRLSKEAVVGYLDAVEGNRSIYEKDNIVPPMAIAALAMTAMAAGMSMPPGVIHVSQDLQFLSSVRFSETITSYAKVTKKTERGKFHMLTIGINVLNNTNIPALTGETSFILPYL